MKKIILLTLAVFTLSTFNAQHTMTIDNTTPEDITIKIDELEDLVAPFSCGGSGVSTTYFVPAFSNIRIAITPPTVGTVGLQDLIFLRTVVLTSNGFPVTTGPIDWNPNPVYNIYMPGGCNVPGSGVYNYTTASGGSYTSSWTFVPNGGSTVNLNPSFDYTITLF